MHTGAEIHSGSSDVMGPAFGGACVAFDMNGSAISQWHCVYLRR